MKRGFLFVPILAKNRHSTKNVEPLLVACFNNMEALVCLIDLKQATLKPHAVYYDNLSLLKTAYWSL